MGEEMHAGKRNSIDFMPEFRSNNLGKVRTLNARTGDPDETFYPVTARWIGAAFLVTSASAFAQTDPALQPAAEAPAEAVPVAAPAPVVTPPAPVVTPSASTCADSRNLRRPRRK